MQTCVGVSVLICTHNRANDLVVTVNDCIDILRNYQGSWEIIICANGCVDDTESLVSEKFGGIENIYLKTIPKPGKTAALLEGVIASNGRYLLVLDDDNTLVSGWIEHAISELERSEAVGIVGCNSAPPIGFSAEPKISGYLNHFAIGSQSERRTYAGGSHTPRVWGAGMFLLARPIREWVRGGSGLLLPGRIGKNVIAGEDTELCLLYKKLGYSTKFSGVCGIIHRVDKRRVSMNGLERIWMAEGAAFEFYKNYEKKTAAIGVHNPIHFAFGNTFNLIILLGKYFVSSMHNAVSGSLILRRRRFTLRGRVSGAMALFSSRKSLSRHLKKLENASI